MSCKISRCFKNFSSVTNLQYSLINYFVFNILWKKTFYYFMLPPLVLVLYVKWTIHLNLWYIFLWLIPSYEWIHKTQTLFVNYFWNLSLILSELLYLILSNFCDNLLHNIKMFSINYTNYIYYYCTFHLFPIWIFPQFFNKQILIQQKGLLS